MKGHLNDHQLLAYMEMEDDLSPRRRERAEAHLRACPACRARLDSLAQTTTNLTATLHAVGEQVPAEPARSWETVARRWEGQRPALIGPSFRSPLRYVATLAVVALLVAGLAGLIHTLAVTGPALTRATPTPSPTPPASPSPATGPLPRSYPDRLAAPFSLLVLGTDGESETSDETDALMLLYLDADAGRAVLLSIPRDLYVEVPDHGGVRAGSVFGLGLGRQDEITRGLALARETISTTLGLPVQHAALMRFESFVALIDAIGGVDVEVPHPIQDLAFPDGHGGYDPLSIPAGTQRFDGTLALRYARTPVAPAPGFDRAFRQRQLVLAAHDRVARSDLLPELIAQAPALWADVANGLETDLSLSDVIDLALLAAGLTADDVATATLEGCCTVQHTTPAGQRVLLPQPDEIEALMESLLELEEGR